MKATGRIAPIAVVLMTIAVVLAAISYFFTAGPRRPPEWQGELTSPTDALINLCYSPDATFLAAGSGTGEVVLWNLKAKRVKTLPRLMDESVVTIGIAPDGFLVASDLAGNCAGWQLGTGRTKTFPKLPAPVTSIAFRDSPTIGPEMALGLADGQIVFFTRSGHEMMRTRHRGGVCELRYSPDGRLLVTAGRDGLLEWRNADTRQIASITRAHSGEVGDLAFSPDGRLLASADWNGRVVIWNAKTREPLERQDVSDAVSALAWIPTQPLTLVAGGWDGRLRFFSYRLQPSQRAIHVGSPILDIALSPDPNIIATVCGSSSVDLWKVPTKQP
ncbi:MAG: WD40 repeat domain-containing protein [Planctomycetes bacterium]|nr:WD40 repeat domain-containing protein [Planctomycetota bacterium]